MRDTIRPMRVLLGVAAFLVLLAGLQLFCFSLRTKEYFAWKVLVTGSAALDNSRRCVGMTTPARP